MKKAMLPSLKIDSWTEEALSDLTAKIQIIKSNHLYSSMERPVQARQL